MKDIYDENLSIEIIEFIPKFSRYKNQKCNGLKLKVINRKGFRPFRFILKLLFKIREIYPEKLAFNKGHFDRLCGTDLVRKTILNRESLQNLFEKEIQDITEFKKSVKENTFTI